MRRDAKRRVASWTRIVMSSTYGCRVAQEFLTINDWEVFSPGDRAFSPKIAFRRVFAFMEPIPFEDYTHNITRALSTSFVFPGCTQFSLYNINHAPLLGYLSSVQYSTKGSLNGTSLLEIRYLRCYSKHRIYVRMATCNGSMSPIRRTLWSRTIWYLAQ